MAAFGRPFSYGLRHKIQERVRTPCEPFNPGSGVFRRAKGHHRVCLTWANGATRRARAVGMMTRGPFALEKERPTIILPHAECRLEGGSPRAS